VVDNLREDWHRRMQSRYETCVRRQGQYPEYQDEKGYMSSLSPLEKLGYRRPARKLLSRKGIKYNWLVMWRTGLHLNLVSEHPDKAFYNTGEALEALRGALVNGTDWLSMRVVTLVKHSSGKELWRKQFMEVVVSLDVLSPAERERLDLHIRTQLGLRALLSAVGCYSLLSLREILLAMGVDESVSGVTSRETVLSWYEPSPIVSALRAGAVGAKLVAFPDGDLFTEADIVSLERETGVECARRKVVLRR